MKNRDVINESEFLEFYNSRSYNANYFNSDGSLNKNYNFYKKTGLFATIFEYHWDSFVNSHKEIVEVYRPNADVEIHKIIDCYNKNLGCSVYECPTCHDIFGGILTYDTCTPMLYVINYLCIDFSYVPLPFK